MKKLNKFKVSVLGFGYLGDGKHIAAEENKNTPKYTMWNNMLKRVFDPKYQAKHPTYIGSAIYKGWANFQVFGDWYDENWVDGWVLDKDILVKGNKAYHPSRCCFVPQEINKVIIKNNGKRGALPIGVCKNGNGFFARIGFGSNSRYKFSQNFQTPELAFEWYREQKKNYVLELAEKYKHQLHEKAYKALVNYQIEITD